MDTIKEVAVRNTSKVLENIIEIIPLIVIKTTEDKESVIARSELGRKTIEEIVTDRIRQKMHNKGVN